MNTLYLSLLAIQEGLQVKGWIVTISGFFIVIIALVVLYLVFSGLLKLINMDWQSFFKRNKESKVDVEVNKNVDMKTSKNNINDDVVVAIGLALSMSMEVHDEESGKLTIKRVQPRFSSPWNSKILGINNLNRY
ncbi:MAG: OadG family protein [Bacteroidales bacterium]|nr:OadG family protein [Bacteroidales bacterium]